MPTAATSLIGDTGLTFRPGGLKMPPHCQDLSVLRAIPGGLGAGLVASEAKCETAT